MTPSSKFAICGLSLSISSIWRPNISELLLVFAGTNGLSLEGNSPSIKVSCISSPSLKIVAIDSVFGFICPTTCGRSALNLISFPSKSKITSPGINPPLSPDSPSSKSFIKAPYGFSIPRASARSLSTSPTLTPK